MRTDLDIIAEAYARQVGNTWAVLFDAYVNRTSDRDVHAAEQAFVQGVELARTVRERSIALLQRPLDVPRVQE